MFGERPGDVRLPHHVFDQRGLVARRLGQLLACLLIDLSGLPTLARWNAVMARLRFAPARPSISPGEKPARSSMT